MNYEELLQLFNHAVKEERLYNFDESFRLCNDILVELKKHSSSDEQHPLIFMNVMRLLGKLNSRNHDYSLALEKFNQALVIAERLENKFRKAQLLDDIGSVYWYLSDYPRALESYHKALALAEELNNKNGIGTILTDIGLVYMNLDDFPQALKYYKRALLLAEEEQDKQSMTVYLGNVGNAYGAMEDYSQCLEYSFKGLAIAEELGNLKSAATKISNIGIVYSRTNNFAQAMSNFQKSLEITEQIGDKRGTAINFINIGGLYSYPEFECYDEEKSAEYYLRALELVDEISDKHNKCTVLQKLAELYKNQKQWEKYAHHLEQYFTLRTEIQGEETKRLANKYAYERQIAEQEKQIAIEHARNEEIMRQQHILQEQAAKIQLKNTELHEINIELDVANQQLEKQAAKIQLTNTELQEKNIELDIANYQLSEQAAKIQLKNTELHETNIELNAANRKLEEAGKFKMKILGIASHDLKNPIAGINLSAEVLMRYEKLSPQSTKMMKNIMNSSKRMLDIVVNLMDVSARELGEIKLTHSKVDITSLVEDISKEYIIHASEKQQTIEFTSEGFCIVFADELCLRRIFDNLISNAIKYSPHEKPIVVSVTPSSKSVKIAVADQGLGLSPEDKALMFGDFQKLSSKPTGGESSSGLGLSVVKNLVELHGGKVWAESEGKGMGSTFYVELPVHD